MELLAGQRAWSAGMVRAVARHMIPQDGAYDIREGLLDDDGNVYQRGGATRITATQLGGAASIVALWEASFTAGRRTIGIGTAGGILNPGGTDWSLVVSGAGGITGGGLAAPIGELLAIPYVSGGNGLVGLYAGSRKGVDYTIGTLTVTNGSAVVTGVGTNWLAGVDAGMLLLVGSGLGVVKSVDSNTQITLCDTWQWATAAATAYKLTAWTDLGVLKAVAVASVGGRLLYAIGRRVFMSKTPDPNTGQLRFFGFGAYDDYHEFPADVVGLATLRDRVFVFHRSGISVISGLALEIVDAMGNAQQQVEKVSGEVVLRSAGGLCTWRDSLVLAAVDGVYVMDVSGAMDLVSRSIGPLWLAHSKAGDALGQMATFRDHLFVSVGSEVLVGRLDRRVKTAVGKSAPWTRWMSGEVGRCQAFAVQDPSGSAKLLGGSALSGYLLNLTDAFSPDVLATLAVDGDAVGVSLQVETRDMDLADGASVFATQAVLEYELAGGQMTVSVSTGSRPGAGSPPSYTVMGTAAANYLTQLPRALAIRRSARRVSFLITAGGAAGARLRGIRVLGRRRGRFR